MLVKDFVELCLFVCSYVFILSSFLRTLALKSAQGGKEMNEKALSKKKKKEKKYMEVNKNELISTVRYHDKY